MYCLYMFWTNNQLDGKTQRLHVSSITSRWINVPPLRRRIIMSLQWQTTFLHCVNYYELIQRLSNYWYFNNINKDLLTERLEAIEFWPYQPVVTIVRNAPHCRTMICNQRGRSAHPLSLISVAPYDKRMPTGCEHLSHNNEKYYFDPKLCSVFRNNQLMKWPKEPSGPHDDED